LICAKYDEERLCAVGRRLRSRRPTFLGCGGASRLGSSQAATTESRPDRRTASPAAGRAGWGTARRRLRHAVGPRLRSRRPTFLGCGGASRLGLVRRRLWSRGLTGAQLSLAAGGEQAGEQPGGDYGTLLGRNSIVAAQLSRAAGGEQARISQAATMESRPDRRAASPAAGRAGGAAARRRPWHALGRDSVVAAQLSRAAGGRAG
jgi:hypothetical protein